MKNTGKVKWYDSKKGYGFIIGEDGKDIFFHFSGLKNSDGHEKIAENTEATYELQKGKKGLQAINIELAQ